jgi:hypothetical protein
MFSAIQEAEAVHQGNPADADLEGDQLAGHHLSLASEQ